MQIFAMLISLSLLLTISPQNPQPEASFSHQPGAQQTRAAHPTRQLFAVRGLLVSKKALSKGELQLLIKPAKDFAEVTVLARENDLVGSASRRANDSDVLDLLG